MIPNDAITQWRSIILPTLSLLLPALLALVPPPLLAQTESLQLNGIAIHSKLRRDIYIGALYVTVPSGNADDLMQSEQHKRLVLRVLASRWTDRSFQQHWTQALLINNDEEALATHAESIIRFTEVIGGDLQSGDEVVIDKPMAGPMTLAVNGVELFSLAQKQNSFFRLLLSGWIGPRPPASNFKRDILVAPRDSNDLLAIFNGLVPAAGRAATIAGWLGPEQEEQQEGPPPAVVEAQSNEEAEQTSSEQAQAEQEAARRAAEEAARQRAAEEAAKQAAEEARLAEEARIAEEKRQAKEIAERNAGLKLLYRSNVMKLVYQQVVYPNRAVDRNQEGSVTLKVTLNRDGELAETELDEASEYGLLNQAALKAVRRAAPFPAAPDALPDEQLELLIPVRFQIPR